MTIKKQKKNKRGELVKRIIKLLGLPAGKKTLTYFTKEQLVELCLYCQDAIEINKAYSTLLLKVKDTKGNDKE